VSTRDTTSAHATAQIFCLIWRETLKELEARGGLKGNKLMYTVYKFHARAYFPWLD